MTRAGASGRGAFGRWGPPVLWAAAIAWSSHQPGDSAPAWLDVVPGGDKLAHAALYAVLGALLGRALGARRFAVPGAVVLATLFGAGDELHQGFVPGREPDPWDLLADAMGALAGAALGRLRGPRDPARSRRRPPARAP